MHVHLLIDCNDIRCVSTSFFFFLAFKWFRVYQMPVSFLLQTKYCLVWFWNGTWKNGHHAFTCSPGKTHFKFKKCHSSDLRKTCFRLIAMGLIPGKALWSSARLAPQTAGGLRVTGVTPFCYGAVASRGVLYFRCREHSHRFRAVTWNRVAVMRKSWKKAAREVYCEGLLQ